MDRKKIFSNLLVTASAVVVALLISEILLSVFYPIGFRAPPGRSRDSGWQELLHRSSAIPGLTYELVPNQTKNDFGASNRINSAGMRDDELSLEKGGSIRRIAVLGDSVTYGFGVEGDQAYANVLEQLLNRQIDDWKFDVLNFGVSGYSTRDEALVLKYKAINWEPDMVIVGYVFNDPEIDPIQPLQSYWQDTIWWQHSHVLRLMAFAKKNWDQQIYGSGDYHRYLHAKNTRKWKSVVDALDDIKKVSSEKDIPVLLIIFPRLSVEPWTAYSYQDLHEQVTKTATEKCIFVLDLIDDFSQYSGESLMRAPHDHHPSKFAHDLVAHSIFRWLRSSHRETGPRDAENGGCPPWNGFLLP